MSVIPPAHQDDTASIQTTQTLLTSNYPGSGTKDDPYVITWEEEDPENPYNWTKARKWVQTAQLAIGTLAISFASSSYTGAISEAQRDLHMSHTVSVLPITLYVLGFGLG